ncbi:uncharacterized protein LOC129721466 [Wyeomyia smithii]|nr:uncharacterized protein LOC129721466 [Wyeomyia smithii]
MIYGTQVAVLTKYSRRSIREYEKQIVHGMASLCRASDSGQTAKSVNTLLQKRRITKKIRIYQMRWWGHVRRRERSHPLRVAARLQARHLRRCRPSFTWWDSIKHNMGLYENMTYQDWLQLAKEKGPYHLKLQELYEKQESDDSEWETDLDS